MQTRFPVVTDTATLAVFDPAALLHRLHDSADWWSLPADELLEMNRANVLFLNLGEDGCYQVSVTVDVATGAVGPQLAPADPGSDTDRAGSHEGTWSLWVPSGQVFIGAGEDTSGGDLEPDGSAAISGHFISLTAGGYQVQASKTNNEIALSFTRAKRQFNQLTGAIRI